jgi:hypothetical protein
MNDQKKSRKVGRPKVSKKEAHSRMLLVRVTTDDYSAFVEVGSSDTDGRGDSNKRGMRGAGQWIGQRALRRLVERSLPPDRRRGAGEIRCTGPTCFIHIREICFGRT